VDAAVSRFLFFERMRDCRDRVANHARLGNAFAHALAFHLISQILNELSYFTAAQPIMIQRAKLISHTNAGIALSHSAYFYQAL
jgi:hypothetical protein